MPGLNIIVAAAEGARLCAALETAMAASALGHQPTRIFVQGEAVALLCAPPAFGGDARRRAAGLPALAALIAEAGAMGIELIACQSGLALAGLAAEHIVAEARTGGLVSFLAAIGPDDRLMGL